MTVHSLGSATVLSGRDARHPGPRFVIKCLFGIMTSDASSEPSYSTQNNVQPGHVRSPYCIIVCAHLWRPSEPLDGRDALRDPTTLSNTTEDSEWVPGSMGDVP